MYVRNLTLEQVEQLLQVTAEQAETVGDAFQSLFHAGAAQDRVLLANLRGAEQSGDKDEARRRRRALDAARQADRVRRDAGFDFDAAMDEATR